MKTIEDGGFVDLARIEWHNRPMGDYARKDTVTMRLACFVLAATAGFTLTSAAFAQVPGGGGVPEVVTGADTPSQDKVICRTTKVIGSRTKSAKMCKTAKQWETDLMEQRRTIEKGQNQRTVTGN